MKREEKASISIMKIICVSIILILISGITVLAVNTDLKDVKIVLQNGYEMTTLTSKTKVSDILEENNIVLNENYFSKKFINHLPNDQLISKFMIELMNSQTNHNHYLLFYTKKDHLITNCIQNILCEHFEPAVCSDDLIDNFIMVLITHLVRKFQYNTYLTVSMFKNEH